MASNQEFQARILTRAPEAKKMKKVFLQIILLFLLSITFAPALVKAGTDPACKGSDGKYGIVRCGCGAPVVVNGDCTNCCGIGDFFVMLVDIYEFIVFYIATPLAVIALTIGGIFMMISVGNPKWLQAGKDIFWAAIIGLALVFGSYVIIDFVLKAIGFVGNWSNL